MADDLSNLMEILWLKNLVVQDIEQIIASSDLKETYGDGE